MLGNIKPEGKQKEVLALSDKEHIVILGTAGSGKTTMALFRAIGLSNLPSNPNVLIVTFNRALVQYMSAFSGSSKHNLKIEHYHKFARGYLKSAGKMPDRKGIAGPDEKEQYIIQALLNVRKKWPEESTFKRPNAVFIDEITFIQQFGIETLEEYIVAERIGRASANIRRDNRKWFFEIYKEYLNLRANDGYQYDWDDMALYVYKELLSDTERRWYDHIIVDEGQDFSPVMIKSLIKAVSVDGSFTFFGDVAQQIYGSRLSWRDAGINIKDGIVKFDTNYRNPAVISAFAKDITNSQHWEQNSDVISPSTFIAEGPKPVLIRFETKENELAWLCKQVKSNAAVSSNVIVCRNRSIINDLKSELKRHGITPGIIDKDKAGFAHVKTVYLSTFHSVKGLEFENVFIPFLSNGIFPDPKIVENSISEENAFADELKLLYVAATRSKYGLFMSYYNSLSKLFPVNSANCVTINGKDLL